MNGADKTSLTARGEKLLCSLVVQHTNKVKVKLSPKCNLGFFFCECIWAKPSCKSIITMKEAIIHIK